MENNNEKRRNQNSGSFILIVVLVVMAVITIFTMSGYGDWGVKSGGGNHAGGNW